MSWDKLWMFGFVVLTLFDLVISTDAPRAPWFFFKPIGYDCLPNRSSICFFLWNTISWDILTWFYPLDFLRRPCFSSSMSWSKLFMKWWSSTLPTSYPSVPMSSGICSNSSTNYYVSSSKLINLLKPCAILCFNWDAASNLDVSPTLESLCLKNLESSITFDPPSLKTFESLKLFGCVVTILLSKILFSS